MAARLTAAQARQLQLDGTVAPRKSKRGRSEAVGPYHTICAGPTGCGEHFTTVASENRHVDATHHSRYDIPIQLVEPAT